MCARLRHLLHGNSNCLLIIQPWPSANPPYTPIFRAEASKRARDAQMYRMCMIWHKAIDAPEHIFNNEKAKTAEKEHNIFCMSDG